jgi:hypothetical protein
MKLTNQITTGNTRSASARRPFPITDYNYQPSGCADFGRCGARFGMDKPSFRGISEGYFNREARQNFAAEAAFFGVIVLTAALPILNSVNALVHFLATTATI